MFEYANEFKFVVVRWKVSHNLKIRRVIIIWSILIVPKIFIHTYQMFKLKNFKRATMLCMITFWPWHSLWPLMTHFFNSLSWKIFACWNTNAALSGVFLSYSTICIYLDFIFCSVLGYNQPLYGTTSAGRNKFLSTLIRSKFRQFLLDILIIFSNFFKRINHFCCCRNLWSFQCFPWGKRSLILYVEFLNWISLNKSRRI